MEPALRDLLGSLNEHMEGKVVGVLLFPGFQILDAFGPVEVFSVLPGTKVCFAVQSSIQLPLQWGQ